MTSHDPLLGRRIGRYEPLGLLGRGGMARVYRALDHGTGREIALKVLLVPALEQPDIAERFRREAHTLASLHHPHIVQVYDYGEHDGITFIAEQLLSGPPLDRELREVRQRGEFMPRERVQAAIDQLADALDYAHARNVIHRDLKPANCIRDARGDLVLTDFGIAKALGGDGSGQTRTGTILGTPAYLSPEQARGDATIGPASDVYAAGVLLFELLAGRVPFDAPQPMAVLMAHLQQPPPSLLDLRPDLPRSVALVVERALAKDPAARYPTAGALAQALASAWSAAARPVAPAPTLHSQNTQTSAPPPLVRVQPTTQPRPMTPSPARAQSAAPQPTVPASTYGAPGGRRTRSPLLPIVIALLVAGALIFGALQLLNAAGAAIGLPTAVVPNPTSEPTTEGPTAVEAPPTDEAPTEAPTEPPPAPTEPLPPTEAPTAEPTSEPLPTIVVQPVPTPASSLGDPQAARALVAAMRVDLSTAIGQGQIEPRMVQQLMQQLDQLDKSLEQGDPQAARQAASDLRTTLRDGRDNGALPADIAEHLLGQLAALSLGDVPPVP